MSTYGLSAAVDASFEDAVAAVRAALAEQGFGVLTEIDVQATMREKLGEETGPYVILGACNPPLAHRGISLEPSLGLLLPCNVTVRRPEDEDGQTMIEMVDPSMMVALSGNPDLESVAHDASARLRSALAATTQALGAAA